MDLFTKLCMKIGQKQSDNNELYQLAYDSWVNDNWKLNVIIDYLNNHLLDTPNEKTIYRCVEMSKAFNLGNNYENPEYWETIYKSITDIMDKKHNKLLETTKKALEKKKKIISEINNINDIYDTYGCGGSRPSRKSSSGCGSSVSYGCGSSVNYGC